MTEQLRILLEINVKLKLRASILNTQMMAINIGLVISPWKNSRVSLGTFTVRQFIVRRTYPVHCYIAQP